MSWPHQFGIVHLTSLTVTQLAFGPRLWAARQWVIAPLLLLTPTSRRALQGSWSSFEIPRLRFPLPIVDWTFTLTLLADCHMIRVTETLECVTAPKSA
jgi:hypothetical protein